MTLNLTTISDASDQRLNAYRDIREKDLVGRQHQFIAEGKVVVSVLLESHQFVAQSLLVVAAKLLGLMPILEKNKPTCPIYCVPQKVMDEIAGFHVHRGILGIGERVALPNLHEFIETLPQNAVIAVLSGISNHDNMGAIFRNAAAFAADGIIVDKTSCDPLYRKSIRVSVGATLKVPYTQGETIEDIVKTLEEEKFHCYALTPSATNYLKDADISRRSALFFGTEGEGLPVSVLNTMETLRIPIAYNFDSLNVATASGLVFSHFADFSKLN